MRDSFGDRLRLSRQRARQAGRKLTQGDVAAAVGVERNTVSRWENGGMLPKDPVVIASLAELLDVTADWLIAGERAAVVAGTSVVSPAAELRDGSRGQYLDPATDELPHRVRAVAIGYLDRLRQCGCSIEQLRGAEALLLAGARNRVSSKRPEARSNDEMSADIDAAWDMVVQILRREGVRP